MKPRYPLLLSLGVLTLLLQGCTNAYQQFYTPTTAEISPKTGYLPYSGKTEIFGSNDMLRDANSIQQRGYGYLGVASFEGGGRATEAQLREQATKVGADVVLNKITFEGSQTTTVPWITYNPGASSTTTSNGVVNANATNNQGGSAYGTAVYSGTSTTTSPGTYSTQIIPVTVDRYKWEATFWRKLSPPVFGVRVDSLSDELRQKFERNTGVVVRIVSDDSPAFRANILVGDVLTAIDDEEIITAANFSEFLSKYAGTTVTFTVLRGPQTKKIPVKLNPART
jgi:hypothetical protein